MYKCSFWQQCIYNRVQIDASAKAVNEAIQKLGVSSAIDSDFWTLDGHFGVDMQFQSCVMCVGCIILIGDVTIQQIVLLLSEISDCSFEHLQS